MRWRSLIAGTLLVAGTVLVAACGEGRVDPRQVAEAQARSRLGPTARWKFEPARSAELQHMRDRAYRYCSSEKPSDQSCPDVQDESLFQYANIFRMVAI